MVKKFYVRGKHQKAVRRGGVYVILALQAAYNMELNFQTERKIMRKGFTLIELLVVVLIIGILASVALPQYYKSVEKSRISEVIEFTRAYISAQNRQWMKTGTYATGPRDLDIGYPNNEPQLTFFDITNNGDYIRFKRKTSVPVFGKYRIEFDFTNSNSDSPYKVRGVHCLNDKNKYLYDCMDWLKSALKPN